jgi:4a-hydroxytetrahydrobiopterin dehydratase
MQLPEGYNIDSQGALERTFELPSFRDAIAFVGRVADLAEEANHHPDITISYKKVTLRWTTHSAGGLTDLDYELASRTDALVEP